MDEQVTTARHFPAGTGSQALSPPRLGNRPQTQQLFPAAKFQPPQMRPARAGTPEDHTPLTGCTGEDARCPLTEDSMWNE